MSDTAVAAGTFSIGGELEVRRLGFGSMQLTGEGVWGPPDDHDGAIAVLRRSVELGVNLIDTADSYGPEVAEDLIAEALHPYPADLVIATKAGLTRSGPGDWRPVGRPEYLRQQCLMSMRRLKVDHIDLFQLHRIDRKVSLEDQLGELRALQDEGKIRYIGLSEITPDQLKAAWSIAKISSVQNLYNVGKRDAEPLLRLCEKKGVAFIPWFPLGGRGAGVGGIEAVAKRLSASSSQVALAWLLQRSPVMLPIPGTRSIAHLEENMGAAGLRLSEADLQELDRAAA